MLLLLCDRLVTLFADGNDQLVRYALVLKTLKPHTELIILVSLFYQLSTKKNVKSLVVQLVRISWCSPKETLRIQFLPPQLSNYKKKISTEQN